MEFKYAYKILSEVKTIEGQKLKSRLWGLNSFMNENGLIRVGGRLRQSSLEFGALHLALPSKAGTITNEIIR